jgi:alkylation response protein AidB-like acyl-CoA dehydrogenase
MDLALTEEQEALRTATRAFLQRRCPPSVVRRLRQPETNGHDPDLWHAIADMGWLGLPIPASLGGGDGDLLDLAVVFEEAGRALAPTTLYSTVAATLLLHQAGDDAQRANFLPPIVAGHRIASIALHEGALGSAPESFATVVDEGDGGVVVLGTKVFVANAAVADDLVVVARARVPQPDPIRLVVVPTDAPGVHVESLATFAGDAQHIVHLDSVSVPSDRVLGGPVGAGRALERTLLHVTALQCVEMVGGASRVLEMTISYVTARSQFGRPIGSFQAVQHHIADTSIAVDAARLAAWQAVWRCTTDGDPAREVAIAKVAANEAYVAATLTAHQLHGGIGFAIDHDLHLWSDRARAAAQALGTTDEHLRVLGEQVARL